MRSFLALAVPALLLPACQPDPDEDVPLFSDEALNTCVREHVGGSGELVAEDLADLDHLDCQEMQIEDLSGLEAATALRSLSLWENEISDLEPLAGLTGLDDLQLGSNDIADLSPLAGLTALRRLGLEQNRISDLRPLQSLAELRWLHLDNNRIDDVSPLCALDEVDWLTLEHNGLADEADELLDCMAELDELYAWHQGGGEARAPLDNPAGPTLKAEGGALHLVVDDRRGLRFAWWSGEQRLPVQQEFSGSLALVGDDIVLGDRVVGSVQGSSWTLCGPTHGCEAHLAVKSGATRAPDATAAAGVVSLQLRLERRPSFDGAMADESAPYGARFDDLDRWVLPSPNQFDAGSCLFMANTGAMEVLLNQQQQPDEVVSQGPTDLSERFLMNASGYVSDDVMQYTMTDLTYTYGWHGGALLNSDYGFAAGYVRENLQGNLEECSSSDAGAEFSCRLSWVNQLPDGWEDMLVPTPSTERTTLFLDPDLEQSSIWKVGLMPGDIVDRIKHELRTKQAPVVIIYNHYLYWHSAVIVGYDDTVDSDGCPMVESSMSYFESEDHESYSDTIQEHMDRLGGCTDHGVFYVRDSIYEGDPDVEGMYSYSDTYNYSEPYAARIIEHSYNWVTYLANHAYTVQRKR